MTDFQPARHRSFLDTILLSPDGSRLRAGWRLLFQSVLMLFIGGCLGVVLVSTLLGSDPTILTSLSRLTPEYMLLAGIVETIAVTTSVFLARRFLDKQPIESLGLRFNLQAVFDILTGVAITLLQMGLIYVLMSWLGWITFEGFAWQFDPVGTVLTNVLLFLGIFIFVAWNEELLSRGYHLPTLTSGLGPFWGILISSAIFGLLHLGNPNATFLSVAGIFLGGVFFAYGYIRTRQLWLPIGMHLGWNFFEGVVFGFPVSGLDIYPLTRIQVHGPELWTGGAFGPEAGLILLPALAVGAVLIHFYSVKRTP